MKIYLVLFVALMIACASPSCKKSNSTKPATIDSTKVDSPVVHTYPYTDTFLGRSVSSLITSASQDTTAASVFYVVYTDTASIMFESSSKDTLFNVSGYFVKNGTLYTRLISNPNEYYNDSFKLQVDSLYISWHDEIDEPITSGSTGHFTGIKVNKN